MCAAYCALSRIKIKVAFCGSPDIKQQSKSMDWMENRMLMINRHNAKWKWIKSIACKISAKSFLATERMPYGHTMNKNYNSHWKRQIKFHRLSNSFDLQMRDFYAVFLLAFICSGVTAYTHTNIQVQITANRINFVWCFLAFCFFSFYSFWCCQFERWTLCWCQFHFTDAQK